MPEGGNGSMLSWRKVVADLQDKVVVVVVGRDTLLTPNTNCATIPCTIRGVVLSMTRYILCLLRTLLFPLPLLLPLPMPPLGLLLLTIITLTISLPIKLN